VSGTVKEGRGRSTTSSRVTRLIPHIFVAAGIAKMQRQSQSRLVLKQRSAQLLKRVNSNAMELGVLI